MFETRIKNLQGLLSEHAVEALIITSPYNIAYLTGIHAFSIEEREAFVVITNENSYLLTDARYTEMVKEKSPFITLIEISYKNKLSKMLQQIFQEEKITILGFEEENISYKEIADLEEKLNNIEFVPTAEIVEDIRTSKDKDEVEKLKKACALTDKGFEFILKQLKPGVEELEIKTQLENFIRLAGGELAFSSIVAFGKNSAIPHHLSANSKLQNSDIILLDFGARVEGYCSDMTRTVFLGEASSEFKKMYQATKEAQEVAIDYLKTHMKEGFELKKAAELANSPSNLAGYSEIPHGLGHGVGLQVHENPSLSPFSDENLTPGMIVTIEPGVYLPQIGGIRIEDTALISPEGLELLTKSSKEIIIV